MKPEQAMKYVDEFRDRVRAAGLIGEIGRLLARNPTARRRPLQIMEVCGGHTHSIFRYGIEGMLPDGIELIHGPGCPVCVLPMGIVDDCVAIAELIDVFHPVPRLTAAPRSSARIVCTRSHRMW